MEEFIQSLRKAELHVHLEGSVEPRTLRELGAPDAPYEFAGFGGFLLQFQRVAKALRSPADYGLITTRLLERLAAQNVAYTEITFAAGVAIWKEFDVDAVWAAIRDAAAAQQAVRVRWILDGIRHFGAEHLEQVLAIAAPKVAEGVCALGIGGDEARGPAEWFHEVYAEARRRGLHLTAHAGETMGPESIWAALEIGAERIGHGIRAIEDPVLVKHLAERRIPLEVSITSNVRTGVVESVLSHPVRRLFDAGVPIVLNTDDPAIFNCTLNGEYALAAREFGFSQAELSQVAAHGFEFAFDRWGTL